jgi:hypothetical protein
MEPGPLTPYESKQVKRIAAWKSRRPGLIERVADVMKWPLDKVLQRIVPGDRAARILAKLNQSADWKAGYDLIRRHAGMDELSQLRRRSLELCDHLEKRVELADAAVVTSESLLAEVGGVATELAASPAEAMLALKSVHRVAGCYGYTLDRPQDRPLVLAVIGLSMIEEPEERVRWCEKIRALEHGHIGLEDSHRLGEAIGADIRSELSDDVVEDLGTSLLEQAMGGAVPFLGSAIGVVLDNQFIREIEQSARCVFQERWLRENGKVDVIAPAQQRGGTLAGLNRAIYATSYAASFGVVFPVALAARVGSSLLPGSAVEGPRQAISNL